MLRPSLKVFIRRLDCPGCFHVTKWFSSTHCTDSFIELTNTTKIEIESRWKSFLSKGTFNLSDSINRKRYVLSMFPYPSGNLHLGHLRVYTIADTMARFYRLCGENVFQPMGFDAFGLPAENAAFEHKIPAKQWTYYNIKTMTEQLKKVGFSFDWDYQVVTCDPTYYKFTQYMFLLLYKEGLVYQNEALVNWDPVDKTVLANEQVDEDGKSWRSGAFVEKKILKQWFIETTKFANSLSNSLDNPEFRDWRDIVSLQKHWIGDCSGSSFTFLLKKKGCTISSVKIWTRYPEFINDCTFVAVAPASVIGQLYANSHVNLDMEVVNPFNNQILPVFVLNDIKYDEGTDVKLINPSIDCVDKEFAERFNLPWRPQSPVDEDLVERKRVCELARSAGIGGYPLSSKLKDWAISRQRRWGTPIPLVHCKSCGVVPVPFEDLPVILPQDNNIDKWSTTKCPKCQGDGIREKDTMDTFVDSTWYFLRYLDPKNVETPYRKNIADRMMPVDLYVGGKEHATLHLYYARFLSHFLHSIGLLSQPEPFAKLLVQGMVMGKTYKLRDSGKYVPSVDVDKFEGSLVEKSSGKKVEELWEKMSKSKYNGIEPDEILNKYGIDTTRLFMLSEVAPTSHKYWKSENFPGVINWQKRIWSLMNDFSSCRISMKDSQTSDSKMEENLWDSRNYYTKGVSFNYKTSYQLSVAISKLQGFTNSLKKCSKDHVGSSPEFEKCIAALIIMMAPMVPHFASELWYKLQSLPGRLNTSKKDILWDRTLFEQKWPILDDNYKLKLIFSVNNSVKDTISLPYHIFRNISHERAIELAFKSKKVTTFIGPCDVLNTELNILPDYEAYINIEINHLQKQSQKNEEKTIAS